jgi:hypothetical protein
MATNQSRRSRDEDETIDDQGRKHDSRGRFTSGGSESENEGGGNGRGGNGRGSRRGRSGSQGQGTSRVIILFAALDETFSILFAALDETFSKRRSWHRTGRGSGERGG